MKKTYNKTITLKWIALFTLCAISVLLLVVIYLGLINSKEPVQSYNDCINSKNALIRETYPVQCVVDGKSFTNPDQKVESRP
jgi:hypothetical protein